MSLNSFLEYSKIIEGGVYQTVAKLEIVDSQMRAIQDITGDLIVGGTLNVESQNGTTRTGTITLDNSNGKYGPSPNGIWHNTLLRLSLGVTLGDGTPYLFRQGVFYVNNPTRSYTPAAKTVTYNLVDKWSHLDGSLFGKTKGAYYITVAQYPYVADAIKATLLQGMGNGEYVDPMPPVITGALDAIVMPYTLRSQAQASYADVLLELNTMLVGSMSYGADGVLTITSANEDADTDNAPIMWKFERDECNYLGGDITSGMAEMYNEVIVIGATVNGDIITGTAKNESASSPSSIERVGEKIITYEEPKVYSETYANELAEYYLKKAQNTGETATFSCAPQYHWQTNGIVLIQEENGTRYEKWLVQSYSLPVAPSGLMSFTATKIQEE